MSIRIGITGVTGFIGKHLARRACSEGHTVVGFSRDPARMIEGCKTLRRFAPPEPIDASDLDVVLHLAGEPILGLWNEAKKKRIRQSRVEGTGSVVQGMETAGVKRLISASAIGLYGNTGERECDESAGAGTGFLSQVAAEWENAALLAERFGARVVRIRIGIVLGSGGGMLRLLTPVFRAGLGGCLGNGCQWMSVIHVEDVAGMFLHAATTPECASIWNAVLPSPVRNEDFTRSLAAAVCRPAFIPVPSLPVRLLLGELGDSMFESQRVVPATALASGYNFRFPTVPSAIAASLASYL